MGDFGGLVQTTIFIVVCKFYLTWFKNLVYFLRLTKVSLHPLKTTRGYLTAVFSCLTGINVRVRFEHFIFVEALQPIQLGKLIINGRKLVGCALAILQTIVNWPRQTVKSFLLIKPKVNIIGVKTKTSQQQTKLPIWIATQHFPIDQINVIRPKYRVVRAYHTTIHAKF